MLSSSEEIFENEKIPYEEALLKSGHMKKGEKLKYIPPDTKPKKKKKRSSNMVQPSVQQKHKNACGKRGPKISFQALQKRK